MSLPDDTNTYEVWTRVNGTDLPHRTGLIYSVAVNWARDWNIEESENARMEMRQIKRIFYPVEATTTYRRLV